MKQQDKRGVIPLSNIHERMKHCKSMMNIFGNIGIYDVAFKYQIEYNALGNLIKKCRGGNGKKRKKM